MHCLVRLAIAASFLASNSASAQVTNEVFDVDGGSGDRMGWSASRAGLVDADLVPDLIVGSPRADVNGTSSGTATVLSGATGLVIHAVHGDLASDQLGFSVATLGDLDGDGRSEFIAGAPFAGGNRGAARVYDGATGGVLGTFTGDGPLDELGTSVGGAGDVNNDTVPDIIIGAPEDSGGDGYARIYSGLNGSEIRTLTPPSPGSSFGISVAGLGDLDGDGFSEVVVGAFLDNTNGFSRGRAYVFAGIDGSIMHTFEGAADFDWLGYSVACAGLVDGDAVPDIAVGAYGVDVGGDASGRAYVYSGADWSELLTVDGNTVNENLGWSVDGVGDTDGDGFGDVLVGSPFGGAGRALVVSGADGSTLHEVHGTGAGDTFGRSVLGFGGDVNADGHPDFAVGAALDDDAGTSSGSIVVYSGHQPWENLHLGLAGTGGLTPQLVGAGLLSDGTANQVQLTGALENTTTNLLIGLSRIDLPFFGGTLVPFPDFFFFSLPVDAGGNHTFGFTWPAGVPSGTSFYFQQWVFDPGAPFSFSASNGLSATTP